MKLRRKRFLTMAKVSRLLAVDASVLRSAGDKAGHSAHCTSVLNSILEICHRAVLCVEIQQEWNKHQSRIAIKWRASMNARKKLIPLDIGVQRLRITGQVNDLVQVTPVQRAALIKDVHLLASAAHGDHVVVSGDQALKTLCDHHLTEPLEWLLVLHEDADASRKSVLARLVELSRTKPNPKLPQ